VTEPTGLEPPGGLVDPLAAFYAQAPSLEPKPTRTETLDEHPNYAPLALALGAAFITAAVLTARHLAKQKPDDEHHALEQAAELVFLPTFVQQAVPALLRMYAESGNHAGAMAVAHAEKLGRYLADSSIEAVAGGYQAGMNLGQSQQVAWKRAITGFGLTDRDMRAVLTSDAEDRSYRTGLLGGRATGLLQRLLTRRADLVGRDEMFAATSVARVAGWLGDVAAGQLSPHARKEWMTANDEKVCDVCGPMHGRTARLDEPFTLPNGAKIYAPLVHPNCRCAVKLLNPRRVKLISKAATTKDGKWDPSDRNARGRFSSREERGAAPVAEKPKAPPLVDVAAMMREAATTARPAAEEPTVQTVPDLRGPQTVPDLGAPPGRSITAPDLGAPPAPSMAAPDLGAPPAAGSAVPDLGAPPGVPNLGPPPGGGGGAAGGAQAYAPNATGLRVFRRTTPGGAPGQAPEPSPTALIGFHRERLMRPGNDVIAYGRKGVRGERRNDLSFRTGAVRPLVQVTDPEDLTGMVLNFGTVGQGGVFTGTKVIDGQTHQRLVDAVHAETAAALSHLHGTSLRRIVGTGARDVLQDLAGLDDEQIAEVADEARAFLSMYDEDDVIAHGEAEHGSIEGWARTLAQGGGNSSADATMRAAMAAAAIRMGYSERNYEKTNELNEHEEAFEDVSHLVHDNPPILLQFDKGWHGIEDPRLGEADPTGEYKVTRVVAHGWGVDAELPTVMLDENSEQYRRLRQWGGYYVAHLEPFNEDETATSQPNSPDATEKGP